MLQKMQILKPKLLFENVIRHSALSKRKQKKYLFQLTQNIVYLIPKSNYNQVDFSESKSYNGNRIVSVLYLPTTYS